MFIVSYVKRNWDKLPKSKFNDDEVVIVREDCNDDYGYGNHSYKGIGVGQDGSVYECESGGCSCQGSCGIGLCNEDLSNVRWQDVNFDSIQVEFSDY